MCGLLLHEVAVSSSAISAKAREPGLRLGVKSDSRGAKFLQGSHFFCTHFFGARKSFVALAPVV